MAGAGKRTQGHLKHGHRERARVDPKGEGDNGLPGTSGHLLRRAWTCTVKHGDFNED